MFSKRQKWELNYSDMLSGAYRSNMNCELLLNMYVTYLSDIRGSITSIVNDTGHFIQGYRYTDYGITTRIGSGAFNEFAYTQGIWDSTTGLYYLNARFYNPVDGRFLTQDPYRGSNDRFDTWHLYSYCAGDPINFIDPSGNVRINLSSASFAVKRTAIHRSGNAFLGGLGLRAARMLWNHAFVGNGRAISQANRNTIRDQARRSSQFKSELRSRIRARGQSGNIGVNAGRGSINFQSRGIWSAANRIETDLHLGIGRAVLNISGRRVNFRRWDLRVTIADTYDFDEVRTKSRSSITPSNVANDFGLVLQHTRMITPFRWSATFNHRFFL